jgi:hypothetical protein
MERVCELICVEKGTELPSTNERILIISMDWFVLSSTMILSSKFSP